MCFNYSNWIISAWLIDFNNAPCPNVCVSIFYLFNFYLLFINLFIIVQLAARARLALPRMAKIILKKATAMVATANNNKYYKIKVSVKIMAKN